MAADKGPKTRSAPPESDAPPSSLSMARPVAPEGGVALLFWQLMGALRTVRPHQWVKNVFVVAPVVFAKEIFDPLLLARSASAFAIFCLLAGAVYTINDLADVVADRQHPIKRFRPIASGQVPVGAARLLAILLVLGSFGWGATLNLSFLAVAVGYFSLNVIYSLKLKNLAYLDVGCIATGFVLRVVGGGVATHIEVSTYILACTALLALFLGFGKRRQELAVAQRRAGQQRASLESYSKRGLDIALFLTGLSTIAVYLSYSLDARTRQFFKTDWLWVSTLFVVLGVWRFVFLVRSRPKAESPTQEMLRDGPFVFIVLGWVALVMWVVYHLRPSAG